MPCITRYVKRNRALGFTLYFFRQGQRQRIGDGFVDGHALAHTLDRLPPLRHLGRTQSRRFWPARAPIRGGLATLSGRTQGSLTLVVGDA
jgi:hypothetical protein